MNSNKKPDEARFHHFKELPGGKTFRIPNSELIFVFDENGGWYDENHFYYNSSGEYQKDPPKTKSPPKFPYLPNDHEDVDYEEEDIDYDGYDPAEDDDDDFQDDLLNQYEYGDDEDDFYEKGSKKNEWYDHEKILKERFKENDSIQINFKDLDYKAEQKDIEKFLKEQNSKILWKDIKINYHEDKRDSKDGRGHKRKTGDGYIVVEGIQSARDCLKLSGKSILNRRINFSLPEKPAKYDGPTRNMDNIAQKPEKSLSNPIPVNFVNFPENRSEKDIRSHFGLGNSVKIELSKKNDRFDGSGVLLLADEGAVSNILELNNKEFEGRKVRVFRSGQKPPTFTNTNKNTKTENKPSVQTEANDKVVSHSQPEKSSNDSAQPSEKSSQSLPIKPKNVAEVEQEQIIASKNKLEHTKPEDKKEEKNIVANQVENKVKDQWEIVMPKFTRNKNPQKK